MTSTDSSSTVATNPGDDAGTAPDGTDGSSAGGTVASHEGEASSTRTEEKDGRKTSSIDPADLENLPGTGRGSEEALDIGEVFELLKNERRRRVIRFLQAQPDGTATLDVLAEHIAALENDVEVAQLSSSQRKRVYIGLYQCHLPKLDDYGVAEFRKNRGIIHLRDVSVLERYLPAPNPDGSEDLPPGSEADDGGTTDADASASSGDAPDPPASSTTASLRGNRQLAGAAAVAGVVLVGMTGLGPLAAVPTVVWTVGCLVALLWAAAV